MVLCLLALPLVTNIKASSCIAEKKGKAAITVTTQPVNTPATLLEQILFPHGI